MKTTIAVLAVLAWVGCGGGAEAGGQPESAGATAGPERAAGAAR